MDTSRATSALTWPGIWLGLSLGGFFDGIVLHQVLQWHHMLTSVEDPAISQDIRLNILADGLFHVAAYAFAVIGLVLLWRARRAFGAQARMRAILGPILMGAGAFNLAEGLVNHHLLGIHHVRGGSPNEMLWDLGFLALGAALVALGAWLRRSAA
jgi:uncharacterized membrane protein